MGVALRYTLIGTVAFTVLAGDLALGSSHQDPPLLGKYRGKMVEAPPGKPQVKERLGFRVVKNKRAERKRPGRARYVTGFNFDRLTGTECVVTNDVSFPFDFVSRSLGSSIESGETRVRPSGRFRLRYAVPALLFSPLDVLTIDINAVIAGKLGPGGTARGTAILRIADTASGKTICDSYGKRRWRAKRGAVR